MTDTPTVDVTWRGALDPSAYTSDYLTEATRLADAAKAGDWDTVLQLLETADHVDANTWRPGGISWYTPLHQAARLGAPARIADQLIAAGAWRTLYTHDGQRPVDIATRHGHTHLLRVLTPDPPPDLDHHLAGHLDHHLAALVESRIRPRLTVRLRHPHCAVLTEIGTRTLWYPVPGMYGGFAIELREAHLYVRSWSRTTGGSGQAHLVTQDGTLRTEHGFD